MIRYIRFGVVFVAAGLLVACSTQTKERQPAPAETARAAQKPAEKVATMDPMQLLDKAIAAMGGIEKLKAVDTWKSTSKGVYMGMQYQSENAFKPGLMRMDIQMPGEDPMQMVMGIDECWMTTGPVVMECSEDERNNNRTMMTMDRAMHLWPLKEDPNWKMESGSEQMDGRTYHKLLVHHATTGARGELYFDPDNQLLVRTRYKAAMMGQPGEYVSELKNHARHCDVMMPTNVSTTFEGRPFVEEQTLELTCAQLDATTFNAPAQVKDGTVVERSIGPTTVACSEHVGPYEKIGESIGTLMQAMVTEQLAPMSPPLMIYTRGPAEVKTPEEYLTEICVTVPGPPPAEPLQKSTFVIKAMEGMQVLSAYGVGDYSKKSHELARRLTQEARKRKLETVGPFRQISYMDPTRHPADKLISEMHIAFKTSDPS